MEIWKDIAQFNGKYQVSNLGNVRSVTRTVTQRSPKGGVSVRTLKGKTLKPKVTKNGYLELRLWAENSKGISVRVHRLVAEAFIPNPENKPQVNHKNGNKVDNSVDNLEWVTCQENVQHATKNGMIAYLRGEQHQNTTLTESDVRFIREHYMYRDAKWNTTTLAKKFGISIQTVLNIANGKVWNHLD